MKKVFTSFLTAAFMVTNVGVSTLTSYAAEENTFTAHVNVYNEETNEPVSGIDVKFVEYDADLPTIPQPQANIVQVLSEWNTSDTNPYEIADIAFVKGHFYAVQIDNIPEGYCYSWEDHVVTGIHGKGTLTGTVNYNIALQPHNPLPKVEYPLNIERKFTFSVVDKSTNQVIEGLDVELAKMELDANVVNKYNYVETVDSWNTAADSYAITIPITYDVYDSPSAVFGIKINNMPEGYTYYQPPEDGYTVCGYYGAYDYRYDLYKGNDTTECIAYIYPEGEPHVYTSTKISDNTTTTTTTTTTEKENDVTTDTTNVTSEEVSTASSVTTTQTVTTDSELTTTTTIVSGDISLEDLYAICNALKENVLDADSVYVSESDKLVIFGSANQEDLDNAMAYCLEQGFNLDLIRFVLITEETSTTTTTVGTDSNVLSSSTTTTTTTITTTSNDTETLPQTGYSNIYKVIVGLAALMTVSGAVLVVKTRKENE